MIKDKIEKYFQQYPKLRVLFFFDESCEYETEVAALDLENIRVVKWHNNDFTLKTKLYGEWHNEKVFLYCQRAAPNSQASYERFPLLGLLVANKELVLGDVGAFMEEFGLQKHQKALVTRFIRELKYAHVQEVCQPILTAENLDEAALMKGLLSAFLKLKQLEDWPVLVGNLLTLILPSKADELVKIERKITENGFFEVVQHHIHQFTGVSIGAFNNEQLTHAAQRVFYNKITQNIPIASANDPYRHLKIKEPKTLLRLNQLLQEISRQSRLQTSFQGVLNEVANYIHGTVLVKEYGINTRFAAYNADMIWEVIRQQQPYLSVTPRHVINSLEELSLQKDNTATIKESLYFLIQAAKMHESINAISSYILDTPEAYLSTYVQEWQLIDAHYRRSIKSFRKLDIEVSEKMALSAIHHEINTAYEKHVESANREWLKCLAQFEFNYKKLAVPKQYDFYKNEVAPYDQKIVVVISDALRYEAAYELLSELHSDAQNTATIRYQLASIPSVTSVGMAQLLPSGDITFQEKNILINGLSTAGIDHRQQHLAAYKAESSAIQYSDCEGVDREKLRELFKKPVVYVYHDVIDATGDKKVSERRTFDAVADAIDELTQFVKKLHSSYNVAKVLITADHGFLYNDREIEEKDKENSISNKVVVSHNRYEIVAEAPKPEIGYQFPLSATTQFKESFFVVIPASVNRYKKAGVGHQFVHGGGSLQELVVPIIESSRKRVEISKKVTPRLVNKASLRIVSSILRVDIFQEKAISRTEKEVSISIGLYKDFQLVSNEAFLILNSTSTTASERATRVELTLLNEAASESFLKLKVFDVADKLNPLIEERVENHTLIQSDF
ncbi:MAG: BREX-1 system phosphatase PglZ type A [Spirosomataceae bacterium]